MCGANSDDLQIIYHLVFFPAHRMDIVWVLTQVRKTINAAQVCIVVSYCKYSMYVCL